MSLTNLTEDQQSALEITKHVTLTANAGSGKTFVLTQRFLEILLKTDTTLKQIAAITFTDKAAGELYGKISRNILEASLKDTNEAQRLKYEKLKKQLVSANISTIHSFCAQILREFPVEAGIDANFSPIDSALSKELIHLSLNEAMKSFEKNPVKYILLKKMIRFFGSAQNLSSQLEHAIHHRSEVKKLSRNIYSRNNNSITEVFKSRLEEYISQIFLSQTDALLISVKRINAAAIQKKSETAVVINELLENVEEKNDVLKTFANLILLKENILTKGNTIKKDGYIGRKCPTELLNDISSAEEFFNSIDEFDNFADINKQHVALAVFGKNFIQLFDAVYDIYENKKNELGYLDFEDILIKTQNVLELPNVRQKLSQKYRFLMVDEYQDTNEIQYEIFLPILERLKTGNLFVVGDEKQSIYKFRDAELSVFSKTKTDVSSQEGLTLSLPASFRMSPILCAFTNDLFQNLFARPNPLFNEVVHTDLICAKTEETTGSIELLIADAANGNGSDSESQLVAKKILALISVKGQDLHLSDVAILCRKRNSFKTLEKAFQKFHLPYIIWEGKGFYQQQIIYDFYNYVSFLANHSDDTALVSILRSPFFFLSDSEILSINLRQADNFWKKLNHFAKTNPSVASIALMLMRHQKLLESSDMVTLLRTISEETNYLSIIASRTNGKKELANLEKLIGLTRNFFKQGFRNVYDYLKYLSDAMLESTDEGQAQVTSDENAVKIMTIHQAKGLEFKAVFIFECHKEGVDAKLKAKEMEINKDFGLMAKVPAASNYSSNYLTPPIVQLHNFVESKKESAELKRLFYVAITRAKNHLYFSATLKPEAKFLRKSFINLMSIGLNTNFEGEEIKKSTDLVYLTSKNDEEIKTSVPTDFSIAVIREISAPIGLTESPNIESNKFKINLSKIVDIQKEEIVSATKVAIYDQCPTKYLLTYEYGYNELYDSYKRHLNDSSNKSNNYEFSFTENPDILQTEKGNNVESTHVFPMEIKGKLIHAILEKNLPLKEIKSFVQKHFNVQSSQYSENDISSFTEMIFAEISNFYSSEIYQSLQKEKNYQNEFQVYLKEKDFYLFGIIDKVVFGDSSITIIDYKTDNVRLEEIQGRAQDYYLQLTFYAYILKKLFPEKEKIILQIIFTKFPDEKLIHELHESETIQLETFLFNMVTQVRTKDFSKKLSHCGQCHFSDSRNNCIF